MNVLNGYGSSDEESDIPIIPQTTRIYNPDIKLNENKLERELSEKTSTFGGKVTRQYFNGIQVTEENERKRKESIRIAKQRKKMRKQNEGDEYIGPWAEYNGDASEEIKQEANNSDETRNSEEDEGDENDAISSSEEQDNSPSRLFVKYDFMSPPKTKKSLLQYFVPKRTVQSVEGHPGGVNKIHLFPKTSHLLLTCGNDSTIKLWDTSRNKSTITLVREYTAHRQAVKDVYFNSDGSKFISCSYDKRLLLWDTKTGDILHKISFNCIPNVAIFNPNNEDEIIVGLSNHKINHYNIITTPGEAIQIYTHHLGSINSLTVIENNKRFMSTADDKSVRFWDWQVNIPVKVIAEPTLHSMPCVAVLPPNGDSIALQAMDNKIHVIQGHGKFKFNNNKKFIGHNVVGYGIGINFTPDGKTIMSGDSRGFAFFWDWKSTKLVKRIKLDKKPITCIEPFISDASRVVMAGLSGKIFICE